MVLNTTNRMMRIVVSSPNDDSNVEQPSATYCKAIDQYLKNTSLHGLRYIGDRSLFWFERLEEQTLFWKDQNIHSK